MRQIQWLKFGRACFIFSIVTMVVGLLMSTYLVENMETYITNGTLESLEIRYDDEDSIQAEADGVDIGVYDNYQVAMMYGDTNRILVANNGLVFKSEVFNMVYYYIIDYSWLPSGRYDHDELVKYVKANKVKQILRTGYLSNGFMLTLLIYPVWLLLGVYVMPLLLIIVSWIYIRLRIMDSYGDDKDDVVRLRKLTRSQFLQRMSGLYTKSKDLYIVTGVYCLGMGVTIGYFQDLTTILNNYIIGYIVVCILLAINYATTEYINIDFDRLKQTLGEGTDEG